MSAAQDTLSRLGACADAREWVGVRDLADAWATCERGDWLIWFASRAGADRCLVARAACSCVRPALAHVKSGEQRSVHAIEVVEAWARGEATIRDVGVAADDSAVAVTFAAHAEAAAYNVASYAEHSAVCGNYYAGHVAEAIIDAADAIAAKSLTGSAAAQRASLRASADIVRATIPWADVEAAIAEVP